MAFPPRFLEELRSRVSISEVIGRRVRLIRKGRGEATGLCPFHNEKTPSFGEFLADHREDDPLRDRQGRDRGRSAG